MCLIWSGWFVFLANFPALQDDLKRVMAGEMEIVVTEEKWVTVSCGWVDHFLLMILKICL